MHGKSLDESAQGDVNEAQSELREPATQAEDFERQYCNLKEIARQYFDFNRLLHEYAIARLEADTYKALHDEHREWDDQMRHLVEKRRSISDSEFERLVELVRGYEKSRQVVLTQMVMVGVKTMKIKASKRGVNAAEIRHSKPGESRDKKKAIQDAWASGKYSSRDVCAEQECAALNMAPGTARKALRNTPEPPSRCTA